MRQIEKHRPRKFSLKILALLWAVAAFLPAISAQNVDSLAALLKKTLPDTQRLKILRQIATTETQNGNTPAAAAAGQQSIKIAEQLADTPALILAYDGLTCAYLRGMVDTGQTTLFGNRLLQLCEVWGDTLSIARAHFLLGVSALWKLTAATEAKTPTDYFLNEAIRHLSRAENFYREKGKKLQAANAGAKIGDAWNLLGRFDKSLPHYENLLKIATEVNDSLSLMSANIQVACGLLDPSNLENVRRSIVFFERGTALAEHFSMNYESMFCHESLAKAHELLGNFKQALLHQLTYNSLKDSVLNSEKVEQLAKLEAQMKEGEVARKNLELEREAKTRERLLFAAAIALFLLTAFFLRRRNLQKIESQKAEAEAQKLRELDEFKNRFFTNISHEFRTPLTVILGMTERLRVDGERLTAGESNNRLGLIKRNGENLLRLINQILDLAKLEDKSLKINYIQGNVAAFARYAAESLHSLANAQNVQIRTETSSPEILMDFDRERLGQVLQNLLSNAVKFTPSGGRVELKVGLQPDLSTFKKLTNLQLSVSDTGTGIPPEDLPHVFERFFQAKNQGQNKAGGTGIGLSLTKELVKAMGGEISVESEVGKGTTFTVRLPMTNVAPLEKPDFQQVGTAAQDLSTFEKLTNLPVPAAIRSENQSHLPSLLILEDNPDVVEYLTQCLEKNYEIQYAFNGRSGIEKALETVPDLIISDVMMPEKDGFEVCDFLKNDERTSHIPIVLLTAKADVESRIAGLRRGADSYLAKPFHPEELAVTLEKLLENRARLQDHFTQKLLTPNHPTVQPSSPETQIEDEFLKKLRGIVEAELGNANLNVEDICRKIGMGRTNLHNKMTALTGLPITVFIRQMRLRRAQELLRTSTLNVSEIAFEVGFDDPKYFSRVFSEVFGVPPSEFREKSATGR